MERHVCKEIGKKKLPSLRLEKNDPTLPVSCLIGHDSFYLYLKEEDDHHTCHCNIKILIFTDHGKTNYYKKDIWNLC